MKRIVTMAAAALIAASAAQAQFGDILKKINPSKIKKAVKVGSAATHEFTETEEVDIGRIVAARILATFPLTKNDKLQRYMTLVGNTVANYSTRPTLDWHFAVLESPIVNAFSTPGGYVFVTTGALDQMKSEAELAAVLGHEIAHTTQKHILKEIKRGNVLAAGADLAASTSGGSFLNDDMARKISDMAYQKLVTTGLGREDELEADKVGDEFAASAGYRPSAAITFLETLKAAEGKGQSSMKQFTATHPPAGDRIKALEKSLPKSDAGELLAERWETWTASRQ